MVLRSPYEISIWKTEGSATDSTFSQKKLAIIGSDKMTSPIRAIEPNLITNANGSKVFSFKMFLNYYDEEKDELMPNPFLNLLVNEGTIKLHYKNEWNDFIIKDVGEASSDQSFLVTCRDLPSQELSGGGYNVELATELENNLGTVHELGKEILKETDWKVVDSPSSKMPRERKEEALYKVNSESDELVLKNLTTGETLTLTQPEDLYLFYSDYQRVAEGDNSRPLQLLYTKDSLELDSANLVLNKDSNYQVVANYTISEENGSYLVNIDGEVAITVPKISLMPRLYYAHRLMENEITHYDRKLDKYVVEYKRKSDDKMVYGYSETVFNSPTIVSNLVTNGKNFTSTTGWTKSGNQSPILMKTHQPGDITTLKSYLHTYMRSTDYALNSGLKDHVKYLTTGLIKGESIIARVRAFTGSATTPTQTLNTGLRFRIKEGAWLAPTTVTVDGKQWLQFEYKVPTSRSYSDIVRDSNGIMFSTSTEGNVWFEEIKIFKKVLDKNQAIIDPEGIDIDSVVTKNYYYYDPISIYTSIEDIKFLDKSDSELSNIYEKVIDETYSKRRLVVASKSNYFNLLQTLAERFEVWVRFEIGYNPDGTIRTGPNGIEKYVYFTEEIGQKNPIGFRYGTDLIDIRRNINSDQIVSKIIVANNSNDLAPGGFCSIVDSDENYAGENFLLNFRYYINQGLIPEGTLFSDLYGGGTGIGYLTKLRAENIKAKELIKEQIFLKGELTRLKADKDFYEMSAQSTASHKATMLSKLLSLTGTKSLMEAQSWLTEHNDYGEAKAVYAAFKELEKLESSNNTLKSNMDAQIAKEESKLETIEETLKISREKKEALHKQFYSKYYRYLKEGTWISEDYIDPDYYYLDAERTLNTSAYPQVQYSINVIDLSMLDEYKNRKFRLGDITTMEDTRFFGWTFKDGAKEPYREKVVITEMSEYLDEPERNQIRVQNYKTQFEELFQRVVATTQSLQYASGSYEKVANVINKDGTIKADVLQNSLIVNHDLVFSSRNDSVRQDNTGITVVDLDDTRNQLKITSKGIFYTSDGGTTWPSAINAQGVATNALTAGVIYTDHIVISQGGAPTFKWDNIGITAYKFSEGAGLDPAHFVRYDQYGIYGVKGNSDFIATSEDSIWQNAHFALTWKGFNLRSSDNIGYTRITSDNSQTAEITVGANGKPRVEMGRLEADVYGFRLRDGDQNIVMTADDTGAITIEDILHIKKKGGYGVGIGNLSRNGSPFANNFEYKPLTLNAGESVPLDTYERDGQNYKKTLDTTATAGKEYFNRVSQVFNANHNFIILEDGSMLANNGTFKGHVEATSGTFSGTINAADGFFSGELGAVTGRIGSATITENGLVIDNGIFTIQKEGIDGEVEEIFSFDGEQLDIKGSASFAGELRAESGTIGGLTITGNSLYTGDEADPVFSVSALGHLITKEGEIGGIKVTENGLESANFDGSHGFQINSSGEINAQSLIIGKNATIADYLKLGDASYIYNPVTNANRFIASGAITLYDNGVMDLGDIHIDGNTSTISTQGAWSLTPALASFNNISAAGSISTMVFESHSTRAAGGSMIFKSSARILGQSNGKFTFEREEDREMFEVGDLVMLDSGQDKVTAQIDSLTDNVYTLDMADDLTSYKNIIRLGALDVNGESKDWIIGVNSESVRFQGILEPNAITFSSFNRVGTGIIYSPKLILGFLGAERTGLGRDTYGLYAESAYLTGTLTTKVSSGANGQGTYAGVNTIDKVPFQNSSIDDDSGIVFWAGSLSPAAEDIQVAPFQVTERGTLFAKQAHFVDSVFAGAQIEASILKTATIIGTGSLPALKIIALDDADSLNSGISIHTGERDYPYGDQHTERVRIGTRGIQLWGNGEPQAIAIEGYEDSAVSSPALRISPFGYFDGQTINLHGDYRVDTDQSPFRIKKWMGEGLMGLAGSKTSLRVGENRITLDTPQVNIVKDLILSEGEHKVTFKQVTNGYDIFIS